MNSAPLGLASQTRRVRGKPKKAGDLNPRDSKQSVISNNQG